MSNREPWSRRVSRRALLGLIGIAGAGLAARGLLRQDAGRVEELWRGLQQVQRPSGSGAVSPMRGRARVAVGYLPRVTWYNGAPPFDPEERYPEYPYDRPVAGLPNEGYRLLREALKAWWPEGCGTAGWSPLSNVIRPGDTVAIKPNLVWEPGWGERRLGLTTVHPSTLRAVVDYVYRACGPRGRIVVCEGTATNSAWPELLRTARLVELVEHLQRQLGVPIELANLNSTPREGALLVQLGSRSMLAPLAGRTLFDLHDQPDWHTRHLGLGSYYVAPQPLRADVVVSLAKLKVHRATGVSLAMKNMFGLIPSWDGPYGDDRLKDVPHYTDLEAAGGPRSLYLENDTTWRTTVDLNQILLYADQRGRLRPERQRRYLAIVDGLIAAGRDMFDPEPAPIGALVVGSDPVSTDVVATRVMGFDPWKVRSVSWARGAPEPTLGPAEPSAIDVRVSGAEDLSHVSDGLKTVTPEMRAYPWRGQVEADDFSPPLVIHVALAGTEARAVLRDASGVAFARLVWEGGVGSPSVELQLVGGDPREGEWRGTIPASHLLLGRPILETGDALLNVRREALDGWR